ncbi:serine hydrolase domain-containing protein [Lacisediminihabitans sp. H27-G8]|uniref:serine hydrolase domain-containing protein n=1 Tax=Lacisediminihabitans sp. H27-G8 TaxID=3111909 RepID=UPI0038FC06C6
MVVGGDASLSSGAQTSSPGWATASEIDSFLQKERADLKLSGLAVVVISQRSIIFERGYGDAAPEGPAVTLNTPFVLGSTSKQLTGLAVQQLIAQGRLSLDDTVGELLSSLGGKTSRLGGVTVRQLLSHQSGISTNAGTADEFDLAPAFTSLRRETIHLLTSTQEATPGRKFVYSNGNYTLLGAIIEALTGQPFEDALRTLVTRPLGLNTTTSDLALARSHGLAVGHYTWFGAIDSTTPGPRWPMGAPSAYTTSSVADLARLVLADLGKRSGINQAVLTAAQAPLTTVNKYSKYASGWYVRSFWQLHDYNKNYDDPQLPLIYEHDGDTARETSYLAFSPDLGFGVVVLSSTGLGTDTGRFGDFTERLLHTIVGTQSAPRVVEPIVAAAPVIMVVLPLLQLGSAIFLAASFRGPRGSRISRWIPRVAAALVTLVTVIVAFLVVPAQTHQPLLDRAWWAGVPDLATSVAMSLLFVAASLVVAIMGTVRILRSPRDPSSEI